MPDRTRPRVVPVSSGTASSRTAHVRGFDLLDARFAPARRIGMHTHDAACVTVVMAGQFSERLLRRERVCTRGSVLAKPPLEPHDDVFGRAGSRQLIVEVPPCALAGVADGGSPWDTIVHGRAAAAEVLAWGIVREMTLADPASGLSIEGLALELLAEVWRLREGPRRSPPGWLLQVRDLLNDEIHGSITVARVAAAVGVHPTHLARVFRAHFGETVGEYVRRLRVEWAKTQLMTTRDSLASIALQAGFTDQAHFTRWFKRLTGVTPKRYRTARS
jgi:AraC family transcriptional regulator